MLLLATKPHLLDGINGGLHRPHFLLLILLKLHLLVVKPHPHQSPPLWKERAQVGLVKVNVEVLRYLGTFVSII